MILSITALLSLRVADSLVLHLFSLCTPSCALLRQAPTSFLLPVDSPLDSTHAHLVDLASHRAHTLSVKTKDASRKPRIQNKYTPSSTSLSPTPNSLSFALRRRAIACPNAATSLSGGIAANCVVSALTYPSISRIPPPKAPRPRTHTTPCSTSLHASLSVWNAASSKPPPAATARGLAP
jgi:hypothetical protein